MKNRKDTEEFKKTSPYYSSKRPTTTSKPQKKDMITRLYEEPVKKKLAVTKQLYPHLEANTNSRPSSSMSRNSSVISRPQTSYSHSRPSSANSVSSTQSKRSVYRSLNLSPIRKKQLGILDPLINAGALNKVLSYLTLSDLMCTFSLVCKDAAKLIDLDLVYFALTFNKDQLLMFLEYVDMNKCGHIRHVKLYDCNYEHIMELCVHLKSCLEVLELYDCSIQVLTDFKVVGIDFKRLQTLTFINQKYDLALDHTNLVLSRLPKTLEYLCIYVNKIQCKFEVFPAFFPRMKTLHIGTVVNNESVNIDSLGLIRLGGLRIVLHNDKFGNLISSCDVLKTLELIFTPSLSGTSLPQLYPFIQLREFVLRHYIEHPETKNHFETLPLTLETFKLIDCKFVNFPNIQHLNDYLYVLQLVRCEVEQEIPAWIYKFSRLDYFEMNECAVAIPDEQNAPFHTVVVKKMCTEVIELCESNFIRRLDISENDFTSIPDSSFSKWTNVKELNISQNAQLELNKYGLISKMKSLEKLSFIAPQGYTFTLTSFPLGFDELEHLTELNVQNVGLPNIPSSLLGCINLRKLNLDNNKISNLSDEFMQLKSLPRLKHFSLQNNLLVTIPHNLAAKSLLTHVDLRGNLIHSNVEADSKLYDITAEAFCKTLSFELFPEIRHAFLPHVSCTLNALAIEYILPLTYTVCAGIFCRVKITQNNEMNVKHYHANIILDKTATLDRLYSISVSQTNKKNIKNWITVKPQGAVVGDILQDLQEEFEKPKPPSMAFVS